MKTRNEITKSLEDLKNTNAFNIFDHWMEGQVNNVKADIIVIRRILSNVEAQIKEDLYRNLK